jgi:hypothetical protein
MLFLSKLGRCGGRMPSLLQLPTQEKQHFITLLHEF